MISPPLKTTLERLQKKDWISSWNEEDHFVVPAHTCAGPGLEPPETAKRLNLRTVVVIDPVCTVVVNDPVEALSLRPRRSSVVSDLLVLPESPRLFH